MYHKQTEHTMESKYLRVAAVSAKVKIGDIAHNLASLTEIANRAISGKINLLVAPELCLTGYTLSLIHI